MVSRKIIRLFKRRRGNLDRRVKRDYIRNGIATIPCRITDYSDIISAYSVKGYETLNPDFADYCKTTAELTPPECPLVLEIIGDCLSEGEKNTVEDIITDDFAYDLGVVEKEEKKHIRVFYGMLFGMMVSGAALWLMNAMAEIPRELFFILFWFMGETLCDYIFLTGHDLRRERRLAGQLASAKIVFSETFSEPEYTDDDVEKLFTEIEKDVKKTIREEKKGV